MKNIEVPGLVIPGVEDITRRDFLVGGAATLLLAGCAEAGVGARPPYIVAFPVADDMPAPFR